MEGKAKILVYGFSAEEQRRIDDGLASLGVPPALQARPAQGGVPLRRILAGEGSPASGPAAQSGRREEPEPLVLFHNISDSGVQALLGFFHRTVAGRPLFAVTTPTTIDWTLGELLAQLAQERGALEGGS